MLGKTDRRIKIAGQEHDRNRGMLTSSYPDETSAMLETRLHRGLGTSWDGCTEHGVSASMSNMCQSMDVRKSQASTGHFQTSCVSTSGEMRKKSAERSDLVTADSSVRCVEQVFVCGGSLTAL